MLSLKMLSFTQWLMAFSIGYLLAELLCRRFSNNDDIRFLKIARAILLVVGVSVFVWLLCNKELFHWNYDIATGEPVNHYSTYGRCITNLVISLVSNLVTCVFYIKRKIK